MEASSKSIVTVTWNFGHTLILAAYLLRQMQLICTYDTTP